MGGMTGVGTPELAAAVSNAGGLGVFAAHNAGTPEKCREWIQHIRTLTDKPFGVNLTILPTMGPPPPYEEFAEVIIQSGVKIIETAGSNPKKWIPLFKNAGLTTIHKCVTIRHALSAEKLGVDIISLDGFECAGKKSFLFFILILVIHPGNCQKGHPGEADVGNFVLQARGAETLSIPFVCSGGVGNGNQLAAALALGADGVNCGTLFCATKECNWPPSFKKAMIEANENDTVLLFRNLHNTARVFGNEVAKKAKAIEQEKGKDIQFTDVMDLVAGKRGREAEKNDDKDGGIWSAGQTVGLIHDIPTCQELIDRLVAQSAQSVQRLSSLITPHSKL